MARGTLDDELPTKTPVATILADYADYLVSTKTGNGVRTDLW